MLRFIFSLRRRADGGRHGEQTSAAEELEESVNGRGLIRSFDGSRCVESLKQDLEKWIP